jgi:hypothetical protein
LDTPTLALIILEPFCEGLLNLRRKPWMVKKPEKKKINKIKA